MCRMLPAFWRTYNQLPQAAAHHVLFRKRSAFVAGLISARSPDQRLARRFCNCNDESLVRRNSARRRQVSSRSMRSIMRTSPTRLLYVALAFAMPGLLSFPVHAQNVAPADPFANQNPFGAGPPPANRAPAAKPINRAAAKPPAAAGSVTPVVVGTGKPSSVEKRIEEALGATTRLEAIDMPLVEAVQFLSEKHDIPMVVDRRALEEIGLAADSPVNINLKGVTLRSLLRLMLRELDLTYMVKDEVMQITTIEASEQNLILKAYALPDYLDGKGDRLVDVMIRSVVPDTWDVSGGPSTASAFEDILVVSTTSDVHDQITEFLQKVQAAFESRQNRKK